MTDATTTEADPALAAYIAHDEFRAGVARGRFRLVVNPKLARSYVRQRLWTTPVLLAAIGAGLALAFSGATVPGAVLVVAGVVLNRVLAWQAPKILLHFATEDRSVYEFATQNGLLEVRRVASA